MVDALISWALTFTICVTWFGIGLGLVTFSKTVDALLSKIQALVEWKRKPIRVMALILCVFTLGGPIGLMLSIITMVKDGTDDI